MEGRSWGSPMGLARIVIFVPEGVVAQYDLLAREAGDSRSGIIRWSPEYALPEAREHVRRLGVGGQAASAAPLEAVPQRRRGRPSATDRSRSLAFLQRHAETLIEEAPDFDAAALRRLLVPIASGLLGLPSDSPLIDEAVRVVIANPDTRPPEPAPGDNRPPS